MDVSRLSAGSHAVLYILFTCAGVTFTALPPLLWRVWLFRARFRPLIAEAQSLTIDMASSRAAEAEAVQRYASALMAVEMAAGRRTAVAAAKAAAIWNGHASAAADAAAAAEEESAAEDASSDAPASLPEESIGRPLQRYASFSALSGGGRNGLSFRVEVAQRALAAAAAATEAERAAAAAASFSKEDAADYEALSSEFEAQNNALQALALVVAVYVLCWQLFGALAFAGCYIAAGPHLSSLPPRGISLAWLSTFLTSSALNNTGLSLLDDSLISIALRTDALMVLAAAIVAGNTGWPVALRCTLHAWSALGAACKADDSSFVRGIRYSLAHPQRCYHLLFDARSTVAVAAAVALTNAFQLAFFYATSVDRVSSDLRDLAVAQSLPLPSASAVRTVMFFQVISVRSAGFQVVDLKRVAGVINVIFAFMFWFAPHPFVAALKEAEHCAALGLSKEVEVPDEDESPGAPRATGPDASYSVALVPPSLSARTLTLRQRPSVSRTRSRPSLEALGHGDAPQQLHGRSATAAAASVASATEAEARGRHTLRGVILRRYFTRHATWLFMGYVTVATAEQKLLDAPPESPYAASPTSLFAILFEVLSAYGTNGLSLGYPGVNYNLVGMWRPVSKLVIIGTLLLGRHRSMPRAVDRPLVTHVRALDSIVEGLRSAERAQRRALEAALAAVQVAEAAAAEAVAPLAAEGNTARPGVEDRRTSLVTALAAVRAHLENEAGTVAVQIQ
jgi:Trk-type K+ transport system membrane component